MPTVIVLVVVAAFIARIIEAIGKCPKFVGDILVCVALLLMVLPGGR